MDEIDRANDRSALELERAVQAARCSNGLEWAGTGFCLNCGEAVPPVQRWCDHDCLLDWQARQARS